MNEVYIPKVILIDKESGKQFPAEALFPLSVSELSWRNSK